MTKLEQKLIELGYLRCICVENTYFKYISEVLYIVIELEYGLNKKVASFRITNMQPNNYNVWCLNITNQQDIDNLQLALDVMQKDLEVLKEYEN